ncbi:MAG: pyrimidine 5'-nucleotidase [Pseudomonadota bacterium]
MTVFLPDEASEIDTWIFDLDNTLYPPETRLFDQISDRMAAYIVRTLGVGQETAHDLRARYWANHGTTLAGLMANHDIDPEHFLLDVHDIDFSPLTPNAALRDGIEALPGRKVIFTNGDTPYAARVLEGLGLSGSFDALYGIEHVNYVPKPAAVAFDTIIAHDGHNPARAAFFEDTVVNLEVPKARGMATIYVGPDTPEASYVDYKTSDLTGFLSQITDAALPPRARRIP